VTRNTRFLILAAICVASTTANLDAQRRAVRRPTVRPAVVVSQRYYRPIYYRPYSYWPAYYHRSFYSPFYSPFYFPFYSPFYYSPFYYSSSFYPSFYAQYPYRPYGWRQPVYDRSGSARLQVRPRNAQVFVDGYFVGLVDDFDGYLQRLHVPAGEHELQFYLEGYRTIREKVLFRPGTTLKVTHAMQPLDPGEAAEPRPAPDANARVQHDPGRYPSRQYAGRQQSNFGAVSIRVQPADAVVLIDGDEWDRPEGEERFLIDLPEGPHRLEVRKDGFRTYTRTIDVRRGQTVTINVSLTSGGAVPALAQR